MSHKSIQEDMAELTGRICFGESADKKMTVGSTPMGDLPGPAKESQKGTGSENTEVKKAPDADAKLQGDTVEKSKKGGKAPSKFDELYRQVQGDVVEEELGGDVGSSNFNDAIGDFPPAGADEESAERMGDEEGLGGGSIKDLFSQLADIMSQIGDKLGENEVGEGDVISDETEIGDGEEIAGEAVESTPAPDGVSKHTAKSAMNVKGVKVVKKAVSSASSGQENGGKPKNQPATTNGPSNSLKANGSGAAADGKNASLFENRKK